MRLASRLAGLVVLLCAFSAHGHIVYGTKTLRGFVVEAELVLRARVVSAGERVGASSPTGTASRPTVVAEVLEVLKGAYEGERVRFAQHGHGVATFSPGEEVLLFLLPIAKSRELEALARSGVVDWVSLQEHDDAYRLHEETRGVLLGAVRDYVSARDASDPALRRATVALLTSGDATWAASALRDLAIAPERSWIVEDDLSVLRGVLEDPNASMGVRAALLVELDRRGLVDAAPVWAGLLADDVPATDRITAIRAAAASAGASARPRLIALVGDPDPDVAAAAAAALGRPRDAAAVEPLEAALEHQATKVRMAAIRALGRIATPDAERVLAATAASHADPETRRRARAELAKGARATE
ncbi:MAG: HEAT repeat domain-containing protein [Myxococcota bacterium]